MATTDANGMVFYGPTDPVEPLQGLFNGQSSAISAKFGAQTQIVRIANIAGRAAAVSGRSGRPISTSDPLVVWRTDAGSGFQIEYTTDSISWSTVAASVEGSTNLTTVNGWATANSDTPTVSRRGGFGQMSGTVYQSAAWNPLITTLPVGYRPARKVIRGANAINASNSDGPRGFIEINTSGTVVWTPVSGAPSLTQTTWLFLPSEPYILG